MSPEVAPAEVAQNGPYAILPGFAALDDCRRLAAFSQEMYDQEVLTRNVFQVNTWTARIDRVSLRPCTSDPRWELCQRFLDEIVRTVIPGERVPDPLYGDFISYMTPGGLVRPHRDDWKLDVFAGKWADPCQVRCNLFLQKDSGSGDPLLAAGEGESRRLFPLDTLRSGDLLIFSPTWSIHAANLVQGIPRIMASFAFLMDKQSFAEVVRRARERLVAEVRLVPDVRQPSIG